jgi:type IV pilus assembly protein PilC
MLKIGEQSGSIDKMMDKAATYYEDELDAKIKTISTTIEPILMVSWPLLLVELSAQFWFRYIISQVKA